MMTALKHYHVMPFTKEDIEEMKFYTEIGFESDFAHI